MHALLSVLPDRTGFDNRLAEITERITKNREYAGVHYESDSAAGETLAQAIWDLAHTLPSFDALINVARSEWNRPAQSGLSFIQGAGA